MHEDQSTLDDITLDANEWTVRVSDKVSTGNYSTYDAHAELSGDLPAEFESLSTPVKERVKAELRQLHTDLQNVVVEATQERLERARTPRNTQREHPGEDSWTRE